MLNKKFIAVISAICVLAIALPVFAHEVSGSGQSRGEGIENCTAHGSGYSGDNAGGPGGRGYASEGKIRRNSGQGNSDEDNMQVRNFKGEGSGFSGKRRNSENGKGARSSDQHMTGNKDGSGNGQGHGNDRNEHKVNYLGQGPRDGSGKGRQEITGQGRKCGPRDGSGEGRGQGFKDGYHRNRK